MKQIFIVVLLLLLTSPCVQGASEDKATSGIVNVKDYGAKGDGITDDTEAIRSAVKAAAAVVCRPVPGQLSYYLAGPALVFPAGEYVISDEIAIEAHVQIIRGEGTAVIRQLDKSKDCFVSKYAWRMIISSLTFLGGKDQVSLFNPNIDAGQLIIRDCKFFYSSGFGLRIDVLSTTVKVEDCEFVECYQAWYLNRCDQSIMRDCWITSNKNMADKAVIENRGLRMTIENLTGVPLVSGQNQRWIDNYGRILTLKQCRFGAEGGGITPVYNFARYVRSNDPWFQKKICESIIMDDCYVSANGNSRANSAVYCMEVPNSINITRCILVGSQSIKIDPAVDLKKYFKNVGVKSLAFSVKDCILAAGTTDNGFTLPNSLVKPVVRSIDDTRYLTDKETATAITKAKNELLAMVNEDVPITEWGGHAQQTSPDKFVDLLKGPGFIGGLAEKYTKGVATSKNGSGAVIVFRYDSSGSGPYEPLVLNAKIDLDKYPWLTWRQREGTAAGSFILTILDKGTQILHTPYAETFDKVYDYHADDLRKIIGSGGIKDLEIKWYPITWGMKTPVETDWYFGKAGQYVALDFFRAESD